MARGFQDPDRQATQIDLIPFGNLSPDDIVSPLQISSRQRRGHSHPVRNETAEGVDRLDSLRHPQDFPRPDRGVEFDCRIAAFEEREKPHMIKMGMEDQHFSDPLFLDAEGAHLIDDNRRQVAHPSRNDK